MTVVEKILDLINKNNITARKLVSDVGLANSAITEWKKGKAKPSLEAIVKIAKYFNVTSDYLIMDDAESAEEDLLMEGNDLSAEENSNLLFEAIKEEETKMHRERGNHQSDIRQFMELTFDDKKLLECYHRLDDEDKEYIRCKMIVLERESLL